MAMKTPPETLRLIAEAARDVPLSSIGALEHYRGTMQPATVLEILDENERLRAGLKRALDIAEITNDCVIDGSTSQRYREKIAELRKLVGE